MRSSFRNTGKDQRVYLVMEVGSTSYPQDVLGVISHELHCNSNGILKYSPELKMSLILTSMRPKFWESHHSQIEVPVLRYFSSNVGRIFRAKNSEIDEILEELIDSFIISLYLRSYVLEYKVYIRPLMIYVAFISKLYINCLHVVLNRVLRFFCGYYWYISTELLHFDSKITTLVKSIKTLLWNYWLLQHQQK